MTWKFSELSEIAEYIGRGRSPVYDDESAIPVLNQACIQHGRLDLSRLKFKTFQIMTTASRKGMVG
jgi:hypothetical protein